MNSPTRASRYHPQLSPVAGEAGWTSEALYSRLLERIRHDWVECAGMPVVSERQLASSLGVDRSLVHRVYEQLREGGMLVRPKGARRYFLRSAGVGAKTIFPVIGIVLPFRFSEYIALSEARQRRQSFYDGIVDRATELGLATIPLRLPEPQASDEEINRYLSEVLPRLNGIIHLGDRAMEEDRPLLKMLERQETPQVSIACRTDVEGVGSVGYDCEGAMQSVADYLKEFGHKRVGIVFAMQKQKNAIFHYDPDDVDGVAAMFQAAGMQTAKEWIFPGVSKRQRGNRRGELECALRAWFAELVQREEFPRAFWCRGDAVALIFLNIIKEYGYQVPQDFSIVGMDDVREAEAASPPLTTLRQPNYDNGVCAVNIIEEMRLGKPASARKLPMTLVARNSVGMCRSDNPVALSYWIG